MNFWEKNLPKKGISGQEEKIWTWTLNSAYLNRSRYQVSSQNRQFWSILIFLVQKKVNITIAAIEFNIFDLVCVQNFAFNRFFFFFLTKFAQKGKKNVFTYHEIHLIKKELKVSSMMDTQLHEYYNISSLVGRRDNKTHFYHTAKLLKSHGIFYVFMSNILNNTIYMNKVNSPILFSKSNYVGPRINLIKSKYRIAFWGSFIWNTFLSAIENSIGSFPFFKSKVKTIFRIFKNWLLDHKETTDFF